MKRYIRSQKVISASIIDISEYDQLSSTLHDNGDTYAIFRKIVDGKGHWAAAKYVNGSPDKSSAFEISYDQARGFEPLSPEGQLSRRIGKSVFSSGASDVFCSCMGDYKGYEIGVDNKIPQQYYFIDDLGHVHYVDDEEQLRPEIDSYIALKARKRGIMR